MTPSKARFSSASVKVHVAMPSCSGTALTRRSPELLVSCTKSCVAVVGHATLRTSVRPFVISSCSTATLVVEGMGLCR